MPSQVSASPKRETRILQSLLPGSLGSVFLHGLIIGVLCLSGRGCHRPVTTDVQGEEFREIRLIQLALSDFGQTDQVLLRMSDLEQQPIRETDTARDARNAKADSSQDADAMPTNHDVLQRSRMSQSFDRIGSAVENPKAEQSRILVSPDGHHVADRSPNPDLSELPVVNFLESGRRRVYLLDASDSMFNDGNRDRAVVRIKSWLSLLEPDQEFQIIFYGNEPLKMRLRGIDEDYHRATPQNIGLATHELDAVDSLGASNHLSALRNALALNPDVIYFLSDGQDSAHPSGDISRVLSRHKSHVRIHALQFAVGAPESRGRTWMQRLATETGGKYVRVEDRKVRSLSD